MSIIKDITGKPENIPLQTSIEDKQLVIRIGIETLAFCALAKNGGPLEENFRVTDALQFAKDTQREFNRETELGDTPLTRMLDAAMVEAVDQGCIAIRQLKKRSNHETIS